MSDNWLQHYFLNRESVQDACNTYAWTTEVSQFERKPQVSSGTYTKRVANIRVITKEDLMNAIQNNDPEQYLGNIVIMFNRRECDFDPSINISEVIRNRIGGKSWMDSFCEYLKDCNQQSQMSSQPHPQKDDQIFFEQEIEQPQIMLTARKKSRLKKKL